MEIVKVKLIRDALNHIVNENAEFILRDEVNDYDVVLSISDRKVFYDEGGRDGSKSRTMVGVGGATHI